MSGDKVSVETIEEALSAVSYPGFPRDIVSLGMVAGLDLRGETVELLLRLPGGRREVPPELAVAVREALAPLGLGVAVQVAEPAASPGAQEAKPELLPGVAAVVAVSSAKGGVGKSTVSTNLACALAAGGLKVGLLDADVYGPSLPIMMGTQERPEAASEGRFRPIDRFGVACMSMGLFLDDTSPVIWRGPMVAGLVQQFLRDCEWGVLDILVIDLPPGTGDAQLTLAQQVRLDGALLVTTPQEVAVRDVIRGLGMFRRLQVPLLGVVENMSHLECEGCGQSEPIFGRGGGAALAAAAGLPLLAQIPLEPAVRVQGDEGEPIVSAAPASASGQIFCNLADEVLRRIRGGSAAVLAENA